MPVPLALGALADAHLLVLSEDVLPEELEVLATSRFAAARWEQAPEAPDPRNRRRTVLGVLRLSRHSTLEGPYRIERELRGPLGLPSAGSQGYLLRAPHERGEAGRGPGPRTSTGWRAPSPTGCRCATSCGASRGWSPRHAGSAAPFGSPGAGWCSCRTPLRPWT